MMISAYQDSTVNIGGISVVSSGHIFAKQNRQISRPSGRPDYLLFYVAKGSELFFLNSETLLQEGDFIFFKPHEKQMHIQIKEKISEFYYVHFNAPDDFDLFGFQSSRAYSSSPGTKITDLFEEILIELQCKKPAYEKICVSKMFNIFSLLERKCMKYDSPSSQYTDKISFIIQKMNKEYENNISLDEYARICNMSKFHFLRVFKEITGCSPIEYRNNIRIEHAKEMLSDTTYTVSEIGRMTGYTSNIYFSDAFKAKVGMSPAKYRALQK